MRDLMQTPLFGIVLTILSFEIGLIISRKTKISIFNPLLISIALIIAFMHFTGLSLEKFNRGGDIISFFLGPATVILAVPLYKQIKLLKANLIPIIAGVAIGCVTAVTSVYFLGRIFGLGDMLSRSLVPKSVTTPIGIEISKQIGGLPSITVAAIIITGIIGAVLGPVICKLFFIKDKVAIGLSIGTAAHAVGTTKAIELGETEGAMSGLAIGIAGLFTVFLAPLFMSFLH